MASTSPRTPRSTQPGWYGWRDRPWNVGALEVWYFSQRADDLARVPPNPWLEYLQGRNPSYPETAMAEDLGDDHETRRRHPQRSVEARQTARRQHARPESGNDHGADSIDAGRHGARSTRQSRQLTPPVFRSRARSVPVCRKTWPRSCPKCPTLAPSSRSSI